MESPSLFEAITRFPGAVIRLPSTAIDTLAAINELAERVDRLMSQLEKLEGGLNVAGAGMDVAATGITQAVAGLQQAVDILDSSMPSFLPFSATASTLRGLTDRLGPARIELTAEAVEEQPSDEGRPSGVQLDVFVAELTRLVESLVGTIPRVRQVLRVTSSSPPPTGDD